MPKHTKYKDFAVGRCYVQKKANGEPTKLLALMVYEFDQETGEIKTIGTTKVKVTDEKTGKEIEKEFPKHKIAFVLHVAQSSLIKVGTGEAKSCNIYFSKEE